MKTCGYRLFNLNSDALFRSGETEQAAAATTGQFQRFDIVTEYSDHHYANDKQKHLFTNQKGSVFKKIMEEWKILKSHLPESIYVRVYEGRIDLLRAAIIGASGTPYHDALFFFDISFPSKYPAKPPNVYYHSHGLRLNPNLYENGYVCLSLINTWHGQKKEKWTPKESTILQLLVSIQGLVLNEKPYFNEPGYSMSNTPQKAWMDYNENAFLLSCKTVMYTIRNPPKNFEGLVSEHFRSHGHTMLGALEAYGNGLGIVGSYQRDGSCSSGCISVSTKFKNDAKKLYGDLENALTEKRIYVAKFREEKVEAKKKGQHMTLFFCTIVVFCVGITIVAGALLT